MPRRRLLDFMNNSVKALQNGAESEVADKSAHIIPMQFVVYKTGRSILPAQVGHFGLSGFRADPETGDRRWLDYLLIGLLTLSAHVYIVQRFHDASRNEEPVTPVKVPPMVQVTLMPPPPKPIVQPPPPPPPPPPKKVEPPPKKVEPPPPKKDVVALKPQKPKPKPPPKPVVQRVQPRQVIDDDPPPRQVVDDDPPPAPVRAAPPPPAPVVEKVTPPSAGAGYLHNPAPEYPEIAEEEGWSGRVVLKVHVLASGKPDSVSVQKSSGHDVLDQAAVRTVRSSWHFAPAMRGSTPTDGWVSVPITFNNPG